MSVVAACEDLQALQAFRLELVLWKHALNCGFDDPLWELFTNLSKSGVLDTTRES